jgi:hypothetical protein
MLGAVMKGICLMKTKNIHDRYHTELGDDCGRLVDRWRAQQEHIPSRRPMTTGAIERLDNGSPTTTPHS